jgi:hypothetical protein
MNWFAKKPTAKEQAMQAKRETRREVRVSFGLLYTWKVSTRGCIEFLLKTESYMIEVILS